MKRFSRRALEATLAQYFELFLTIAGVVIAMLLTLLELSKGELATAIVFLIWLQGFLIWAVHRHGWFQRKALIHNLQVTLNEAVNERLSRMLTVAELRTRLDAGDERPSEAVITAALDNLTAELESLRAWDRQLRPLSP